jgi:hypothetical protein
MTLSKNLGVSHRNTKPPFSTLRSLALNWLGQRLLPVNLAFRAMHLFRWFAVQYVYPTQLGNVHAGVKKAKNPG